MDVEEFKPQMLEARAIALCAIILEGLPGGSKVDAEAVKARARNMWPSDRRTERNIEFTDREIDRLLGRDPRD